jgi:uncharacterized protein (TIGR02588 family)
MSSFSQLPENKEGSIIDRVALVCAVVSVACVLGAHALDRLAQAGAPPGKAAVAPGVDYSSTGSIGKDAAAAHSEPCGADAVTLTPELRQNAAPQTFGQKEFDFCAAGPNGPLGVPVFARARR